MSDDRANGPANRPRTPWAKASIAAAVAVVAGLAWAADKALPERPVAMPAAEAARLDAWDFRLTAIDGEPLPMRRYAGKVVLLVNTASFCGYTKQFAGLQAVQTAYAPQGFTVVGVPSGDFAGQEYGGNKEIAQFCRGTFGIRFPMAERGHVVGKGALPIYRWAAARLGPDQGPKWNFHKYLIGRDGALIAAFPSAVEPGDPKLRAAIEAALRRPAPRQG
jgi:glutathione peroxidase